jgi:hypothetical protein
MQKLAKTLISLEVILWSLTKTFLTYCEWSRALNENKRLGSEQSSNEMQNAAAHTKHLFPYRHTTICVLYAAARKCWRQCCDNNSDNYIIASAYRTLCVYYFAFERVLFCISRPRIIMCSAPHSGRNNQMNFWLEIMCNECKSFMENIIIVSPH